MLKKKNQAGASAIEFAFLLPVLAIIAFGLTEYGRAIYQYDTLAKAVRTAVRHLSEHSAGDPVAKEEARCLASTGNYSTAGGTTSCTGSALAPGLTKDKVFVCDATDISACGGTAHANVSTGTGVTNLVTVLISGYTFQSAVTYVAPSQITFGDIGVTMRQDL